MVAAAPRDSYAGDRVVHDADSHLMEDRDFLRRHTDPGTRARLEPLWMRGLAAFADEAIAEMDRSCADPARRAAIEAQLMERKNWWALGAHDGTWRSRALDLFGFRSQLVFSTHSSRSLLHPIRRPAFEGGAPPPGAASDPDLIWASVRAHNRAIAEFCHDDPRLLAVGWVRLDDPARAVAAAREALEIGCAAIEIPSAPPPDRSLTHVDFEPLYALVEEADRPLIFHLGSGGELPAPVFAQTGRTPASDPDGNSDPLRRLRVVALPAPVELTLAALVLDGVLERHPGLRVGVIEQGATWVPGFLRQLDLAVRLDTVMRGHDHSCGDLPRPPSEYILEQVRFTPFPQEPLGWLIDQTDDRLFLFSTDYPHAEGGERPLEDFLDALADRPAPVVDRFLRANFEDLLGGALPRY